MNPRRKEMAYLSSSAAHCNQQALKCQQLGRQFAMIGFLLGTLTLAASAVGLWCGVSRWAVLAHIGCAAAFFISIPVVRRAWRNVAQKWINLRHVVLSDLDKIRKEEGE